MKTIIPSLRRFAFSISIAVTAAATFAMADAATPPDDVVLRAMRDELTRSTSQLQLENLEKPYFISYRVNERSGQNTTAEFGSTVASTQSRNRSVNVEVRVGSPALDNTNFIAGMSSMSLMVGTNASLTSDDNYDVLRRQLWLATDRAYKQAVEQLSRKRAALENKTRTDETPDFSAESPATVVDQSPASPVNLRRMEALTRTLSAVFREIPAVATSTVGLSAGEEITWYLNSEGGSYVRSEFSVNLIARAATQAQDGFPIEDHFAVFRRKWDELPKQAELIAAVRELGQRIAAQRDAALLEQYNGPVLFEGQAAGELFAQAFASNLLGRKRPVTESNQAVAVFGSEENPFLDKIGARVLPDFLSVTDDPTRTNLGGEPLFGAAKVDDEGVPTQVVPLVEKGRLKTLLVSRSPVRGVLKSTGSSHSNGPSPTNLIVTSAEGLDAAALKAELLKAVQQRGKEYGIIIRRLGNPLLRTERTSIIASRNAGLRVEPAVVAVKVFPDGHEEPLRNVEIAGLDVSAFKDILCAGRDATVTTVPYRSSLMGASIVSFAVPSLLFEDVTLKKPSGNIPKPPFSKHPFFAGN